MAVTDPTQFEWIEIFYSKPSMRDCHLLEKLPSGAFAAPSPSNRLVDASGVRPGFRVHRLQARELEFILSDAAGQIRDDNHGDGYALAGHPGRYVVEQGVRRVGDADAPACFQAVKRPADRFIHLAFHADLWEHCFVSFQRDAADWTPAPGEQMTLMARPGQEGRHFEIVIQAQRLAFAFNDGADTWDANNGLNYEVPTCGRYNMVDGAPVYVGPTERDVEQNPSGRLPPAAPAPRAPAPDPITPDSIIPVSAHSPSPPTRVRPVARTPLPSTTTVKPVTSATPQYDHASVPQTPLL